MNDVKETPPPPPPAAPALASAPIDAPPVAYPTGAQIYRKSPGLAGILSLLPGIGHVYLGLYQRGVLFFAVWALLIMAIERSRTGLPFGLMMPFWIFFVLIDAVRQARAINATGAPESNLLVNEKAFKPTGGLAFGVFLILVGLFFLADRFVTIDLSWLFDWWPLLLIAFGAWQVFSYMKAKQERERGAAAKTDPV